MVGKFLDVRLSTSAIKSYSRYTLFSACSYNTLTEQNDLNTLWDSQYSKLINLHSQQIALLKLYGPELDILKSIFIKLFYTYFRINLKYEKFEENLANCQKFMWIFSKKKLSAKSWNMSQLNSSKLHIKIIFGLEHVKFFIMKSVRCVKEWPIYLHVNILSQLLRDCMALAIFLSSKIFLPKHPIITRICVYLQISKDTP